jgi:hypothetical protein
MSGKRSQSGFFTSPYYSMPTKTTSPKQASLGAKTKKPAVKKVSTITKLQKQSMPS